MTITFSILTKVIIKLIMMIISASVITMRIVSGAGSCSPSSSAGEYFFLPQKRIIDARGRWYWNSVARSLKQLDLRLSNDPLGAVREQFFIPVFSSFFFFFFLSPFLGAILVSVRVIIEVDGPTVLTFDTRLFLHNGRPLFHFIF